MSYQHLACSPNSSQTVVPTYDLWVGLSAVDLVCSYLLPPPAQYDSKVWQGSPVFGENCSLLQPILKRYGLTKAADSCLSSTLGLSTLSFHSRRWLWTPQCQSHRTWQAAALPMPLRTLAVVSSAKLEFITLTILDATSTRWDPVPIELRGT